MSVTDRDEWLHPDAVHDEVVLEVGDLDGFGGFGASPGADPAAAPAGAHPGAPPAGPGPLGPPPGSGPMAPPPGSSGLVPAGGLAPPVGGLVLRMSLVVTPAGRHAHLTVALDGLRARHDAEELGPPPTNWDRMRLGGVEWRMVEPLQRWELSVEDLDAGMRAYLTFTATALPARIPDGYEQPGTVTGQVQLAEVRTTVPSVPARRTHTWR